ncbi:probable RNA-directed DNA polymerase from transposon X-element [Trichonephila clavipes]|nr:probable RNA-directed DNA polymerase from transposon X-element [Trichonephila clavipes]
MMKMNRHQMNDLSLGSWNANGLLSKISEFKLFVEKNDRITNGPARGGTLIFIKSSIPHFNSPTLHHVEATTVTLTPPNTNHISITSIYVPPRSDNLLFPLDLETILQINSNCVILGDFNATHNSWNCSNNSTRDIQLKNFADITNLEIAFPNTPTRYGCNSSNTLDFALISNFNFPYNIESISELSSDHNPVMLSFTSTSTIHKHNPRAITTCWSAFSSNLKNQIHLSDFSKINSSQSLEENLTKFTDVVSSAHNSASKPITNKRHSYTQQHIKDLITRKTEPESFPNAR